MKTTLTPGAGELREIPGHPTGQALPRAARFLPDPSRYTTRRLGGEGI